MFEKIIISIMPVLLLSGMLCAPFAKAQDAQAALIKGKSFVIEKFIIPNGLNEDEKRWYIKFQEGNFLVDGWQDIKSSILEQTPAANKEEQAKMLDNLGQKIGTEWCKENEIRKVDTTMLKVWGKDLKAMAKKDPSKLHSLLVSINNQLDNLAD